MNKRARKQDYTAGWGANKGKGHEKPARGNGWVARTCPPVATGRLYFFPGAIATPTQRDTDHSTSTPTHVTTNTVSPAFR